MERKKEIHRLKAKGIEIDWQEDLDILDIDVNNTLTPPGEHLGLDMLLKIDGKLYSYAKSHIANADERGALVRNLIGSLGVMRFKHKDFIDIGRKVAVGMPLDERWIPVFKEFKDSEVHLWSTTPIEAVHPYVQRNVQPYFTQRVNVHATKVEVYDGVLTGRAICVVDNHYRARKQKERNDLRRSSLS